MRNYMSIGITVATAIFTAIVTATLWVNKLQRDVYDLKKLVTDMSLQLKQISPIETKKVGYNDYSGAHCNLVSFLAG